jgi:hypothetical protein
MMIPSRATANPSLAFKSLESRDPAKKAFFFA